MTRGEIDRLTGVIFGAFALGFLAGVLLMAIVQGLE